MSSQANSNRESRSEHLGPHRTPLRRRQAGRFVRLRIPLPSDRKLLQRLAGRHLPERNRKLFSDLGGRYRFQPDGGRRQLPDRTEAEKPVNIIGANRAEYLLKVLSGHPPMPFPSHNFSPFGTPSAKYPFASLLIDLSLNNSLFSLIICDSEIHDKRFTARPRGRSPL